MNFQRTMGCGTALWERLTAFQGLRPGDEAVVVGGVLAL